MFEIFEPISITICLHPENIFVCNQIFSHDKIMAVNNRYYHSMTNMRGGVIGLIYFSKFAYQKFYESPQSDRTLFSTPLYINLFTIDQFSSHRKDLLGNIKRFLFFVFFLYKRNAGKQWRSFGVFKVMFYFYHINQYLRIFCITKIKSTM